MVFGKTPRKLHWSGSMALLFVDGGPIIKTLQMRLNNFLISFTEKVIERESPKRVDGKSSKVSEGESRKFVKSVSKS